MNIAYLANVTPHYNLMKLICQTWLFVLLSCYCYAQGLKVTGKVTDEKGDALMGASVMEKGTGNGTITDENGAYSFTVGYNNATLVVTYVGYNKLERALNGAASLDFALSDATVLNQVTVVGSRNLNRSSTDTPAAGGCDRYPRK